MSAVSGLLRIVPPALVVRRPHRMVERHVYAYRRQWLLVVSGFFEPLLYLLSMRAGVGALVGEVSVGGRSMSYEAFVAPALMAASAMNGAVFDSTGNVLHRLKYARIYDAALATPMRPGDVAVGEITWALLRGQIYAVGFLAVMAALGLTESWWCIASLPVCALVGLTFASLGFLGTSYMRGWADLEIVTVVTMPVLLFSATFFPLSSYGSWAWLVNLSPLYHGVVLTRAANSGVWSLSLLAHAAVLVIVSVVALVLAARRVERLLCR